MHIHGVVVLLASLVSTQLKEISSVMIVLPGTPVMDSDQKLVLSENTQMKES